VVVEQRTTALTQRVGESLRGRTSLLYPVLAVATLIAVFSVSSDKFLTVSNTLNVGRQIAVLMLLALAGTLIILMGSIDLSVAGIATLAGVVFAQLANDHGFLVGIAAALAVGAGIGLANGSLVLLLRVPSFLVTLGTLFISLGAATSIASGPIFLNKQSFSDLVNGSAMFGVPNVILLTLAIVVLLSLLTSRTPYGHSLYAIGGGEEVAAVAGIPIRRYKLLTFALGGLLCALAGLLVAGQAGYGVLDIGGNQLLLDSIAAVVMGGTALSGGIGGPHRAALGVVVIAILANGMDLVGFTTSVQEMVKGFVIIAAVALTIDRKKYGVIK
jgi:ribose transport system permease protein/putative xylitol transport system permease protein